mgnify:CR=1 FL=1
MNDKDVILTEGRPICPVTQNRDSQFDQIRGVQISSTNQPIVHLTPGNVKPPPPAPISPNDR